MPSKIIMGSLMLAEGTHLPPSVLLESTLYTPGWCLLKNITPSGLKKIITQAGWQFFFLATELEMIVYGWDEEATIRKAIRRLTAQSKTARYNCVEITKVATQRFFGIPYVRITAHSRQIQQGNTLMGGQARIPYVNE